MNPPMPPHYDTSLKEIFWGGNLVAITAAMHGFGMLPALRANGGLEKQIGWARTFTKGTLLLILAGWVILLVHSLEVFAWAGFYLDERGEHDLRRQGQRRASVCNFVLMDYTTLESSYNLHLRWRLLERIIAVAGLRTLAWSAGIMLTPAPQFQGRQMMRLKQRRSKHRNYSAPPAGGGRTSPPSGISGGTRA